MALKDGELFAKKYRVVKLLAKGGMGEVYEVENTRTGAHFALKVMKPELVSTQADR